MAPGILVSIGLAIVIYAAFGTFNSLCGGRIDAALSSAIFNGIAAVIAVAVVISRGLTGTSVLARPSGIVYSVLAGVAIGVFSILLIRIYATGGQLSYVFPSIYGGAIALTAVVGWVVLKNDITPLRVAAVCVIASGIAMLALS